jgi:DNA-directed RNA polymerase specialized sigma24 family protein
MTRTRIELLLIEYSNIAYRKRELLSKMTETQDLRKNTEDTLKAYFLTKTPKSKDIKDIVLQAVQNIIDMHEEHLDYYKKQLKQLNDLEISVYEALKCLSPTEYDIIYMRYINGNSWSMISTKCHYYEGHCRKIRDIALKKIQEAYKGEC